MTEEKKKAFYSTSNRISTIVKESFSDWYFRKTGKSLSMTLGDMTPPQKEELFLLWKHGLSKEANQNLEQTDKAIISLYLQDISHMKGSMREFFERKIKWETTCNKYRRMLDLPEVFIPALHPQEA